ncbi:hypothetical protein I4U23_001694 [Adineta vaga]|nr:hypothetical protein I4U23_001694 [Adineta vaga]
MFSRVPLQSISNNIPDYSYEPYYDCYYYENQSIYMENIYPRSDQNFHSTDTKKKSSRRSKHIPHHLRPQHVVQRRNQRERLRVQDVNQAFYTLQQLLPIDSNSTTSRETKEQYDTTRNSSRISKVQTLRAAVDYIEALQNMLNETY